MRNYTELQKFHQSAFTCLTKAKHNLTQEIVCIKTISNLQDQQLESFEKSIFTWKCLNHPNIVKYIDSFIEDKTYFIVMEYLEGQDSKGQDLRWLIQSMKSKKEHIQEQLVIHIFSQLISALKYMRENKVIHRNITPSNIFLLKNGNVKLIDFASSRMIFTEQHTKMTFSIGDLLYRSPEMLNQQEYFYMTDIWSLGCVLYELIALEHPFKKSSPVSLAKDVFTTSSPPLPSSYSLKLRKTIQHMLEPDQFLRITIDSLAMDPALKFVGDRKTAHDWFLLGCTYEIGMDVEINLKKAMECYKLAAEEGHSQACVCYGRALEYGYGSEKNAVEAMKYYLQAASAGNTLAMNDYARGLRSGTFGIPNVKEALIWYKKSAEEGSSIGMNEYGKLLEEGIVCPKNLLEAQCQFRTSAKKWNKKGMYNYARSLELGFNGKVDIQKALKYYQRAADAGSKKAQKAASRLTQ